MVWVVATDISRARGPIEEEVSGALVLMPIPETADEIKLSEGGHKSLNDHCECNNFRIEIQVCILRERSGREISESILGV